MLPGEGLWTLVTFEGLLVSVHAQVPGELGWSLEGFGTMGTLAFLTRPSHGSHHVYRVMCDLPNAVWLQLSLSNSMELSWCLDSVKMKIYIYKLASAFTPKRHYVHSKYAICDLCLSQTGK